LHLKNFYDFGVCPFCPAIVPPKNFYHYSLFLVFLGDEVYSLGTSEFLSHWGFLIWVFTKLLYFLIRGCTFSFLFVLMWFATGGDRSLWWYAMCWRILSSTVVTIYLIVPFVSVLAICWVCFWVSCILGYGDYFVFLSVLFWSLPVFL